MNSLLTSLHLVSSHPTTTVIPAANNVRMPPPETRGSGSTKPITTRFIPASTNAFEQGGVRPK